MGQLRFRQMVDNLLNREYNLGTGSDLATRKEVILNKLIPFITQGTYDGVTVNRYTAVNSLNGAVSINEENNNAIIYDASKAVQGNPYNAETHPLKTTVEGLTFLKMHMDAVKNQTGAWSNFGNSVRVYYTTSSYSTLNLDLFKQMFADYLIFDFDNFEETIYGLSKHSFVGAYNTQGQLILNTISIALRYLYNNEACHFPFIPSPQGNEDTAVNGGNSERVGLVRAYMYTQQSSGRYSSSATLLGLLNMYSAVNLGVNPTTTSDISQLRGTNIRLCNNSSGNRSFFIFKKEIVDQLLEDLYDLTGLPIDYTGDIPAPTPAGEAIETAPGQPDNAVDNQGGTGDFSSDSIDDAQAGATGTTGYAGTTYAMNKAAMDAVKAELWDSNYLVMIRDYLAGQQQGTIINCLLFPFNVTTITGGQVVGNIMLGTHPCPLTGSADAYAIATGMNCRVTVGTLTGFQKVLGGFLDDDGVTECYIHLPFVGLKQIDPQIIYGHTVSVDYVIDLQSGECQALIYSNMLTQQDGQTFTSTPCLCYEFQGQAGIPVGFTESNINSNRLTNMMGLVKAGIAEGKEGVVKEAINIGIEGMTKRAAHMEGSSGSAIERMKSMDVYLLFIRPKTFIPKNYNKMKGRPSQQDLKLSECTGFTVVDNPIIETTATDAEREQIIQLLKEGVRIK